MFSDPINIAIMKYKVHLSISIINENALFDLSENDLKI